MFIHHNTEQRSSWKWLHLIMHRLYWTNRLYRTPKPNPSPLPW